MITRVYQTYLFCYLIFLFSCNAGYAQDYEWAKGFGSPNYGNSGEGVRVDALGNVYTTGNFQGTVDFDPGTAVYNLSSPTGTQSAYVMKSDANGAFLWAKITSGGNVNVRALALDNFGNTYSTGYFTGTVDFDPGPGTFTLAAVNASVMNISAFILKLDASGNFVWAKGLTGFSDIHCIELDALGNVLATGYFRYLVDFDPGIGVFTATDSSIYGTPFVLKLNGLGNFSWCKIFNGIYNGGVVGGGCGTSVALDALGNVYTTGIGRWTVDYDPGIATFTLTNNTDIYISKLDPSGNFVWAKSIVPSAYGLEPNIAVDIFGGVYLNSSFGGITDMDPGPGVQLVTSTNGSGDVCLVKLSPAGNFIRVRTFPGVGTVGHSQSVDVKTDSYGNAYVSGWFYSTVDFDPGPSSYFLTAGFQTLSAFISKLDSTGNFSWCKAIHGNDTHRIGNSICIDPALSVYGTGFFQGSTDFDPGPSSASITAIGASDIFVLKLSCPSGMGAISGPTILCAGSLSTYTAAAISNVSVYNWTVSGGSVISPLPNVNTSYMLFAPGTASIIVTATNSCASAVSASLAVLVNPLPVITASAFPSSSLCTGASLVLNTSGASTYTWSNGANNGVPFPVSSNTVFSVTGTNSNNCQSTATLAITVYTLPVITVSALPSPTICSGNSLTLNGNGAISYTLSNGPVNGQPFVPLSNAVYTLTGANQDNCMNTTTVGITVYTVPLITISAFPSPTVCAGSGISTDAAGALTYTWSNGVGNDQTFYPFISAINTVTATAANGCTNVASIAIVVNPLPVITPLLNQQVAAGGVATFTIAAGPLALFKWQEDGGQGFYNLSNSGTYSGVTSPALIINNVGAGLNGYKYRCIVSELGCFQVSAVATLSVLNDVGMEVLSGSDLIRVYPNPANDILFLELVQAISDTAFMITDALGRELHAGTIQERTTEISMADLPAGIYLLRINNAAQHPVKIIKE